MEPRQQMKLSIRTLKDDMDRVGAIIRSVEQELGSIHRRGADARKLENMKEELGEVHARLDGVREFLEACERRATAEEPEEQDIDLWL